MTELFMLYKLIILYLLDKVDFPLSNAQLSEFLLDKEYTTYFKQQQALSELIISRFIREESSHNRTFYHITDEGVQTLLFFKNEISAAITEDIDAFIKEKKFELKNEVSIKCDYYKNTNMEYAVRCQVIERGVPLIDLTVTAPTKNEAERIRNNWNKKNQQIYALIMTNLL